MKIDTDTSAETVTYYSIFDRTLADIDDPDLAGDLGRLAASLDYLNYLARAHLPRLPRKRSEIAALKPNGRRRHPGLRLRQRAPGLLSHYPRGRAPGPPLR